MEVRDQTQSAFSIDQEAQKYSTWVEKLDEQCNVLTQWIDFVERDAKATPTTSNGLSFSQVSKDLKVRLVEILQV